MAPTYTEKRNYQNMLQVWNVENFTAPDVPSSIQLIMSGKIFFMMILQNYPFEQKLKASYK